MVDGVLRDMIYDAYITQPPAAAVTRTFLMTAQFDNDSDLSLGVLPSYDYRPIPWNAYSCLFARKTNTVMWRLLPRQILRR